MARVTIELPTLLADVVEGRRTVEVEAASVADALEALFAELPTLRVHVFDESGAFRQHVLCFHNDVNTRWTEDLAAATADGDRVTIMQAVSGG